MTGDALTRDLDTPSATVLRNCNEENQTNAEKGNDFNHTLKAAIDEGLNSERKKGKRIWQQAKSAQPAFTHAQSKKHAAILYKWTTKILRNRKNAYHDGLSTLNKAHYDDTRSELDGMLIHTCCANTENECGHPLCKKNKYSKQFCKAKIGKIYVSNNFTDEHHKPTSYPSVKVFYEMMKQHYFEYFTNELLYGLFIALNSNVNQYFNSLLCSICMHHIKIMQLILTLLLLYIMSKRDK